MSAHLWESTLFLLAIAVVTRVFRRNGAHVRHALWLAASVKFLVPFAALVAIGNQFGWVSPFAAVRIERTLIVNAPGEALPAWTPPPVAIVPGDPDAALGWMEPLGAILPVVWLAGALVVAAVWVRRRYRVARIARDAAPLAEGRELAILRRLERESGTRHGLPVLRARTSLEPGIFGIVRPVLLWPEGISERLSDAQIESILAHELAHARRRDNLSAAIQAVVQAVFWFHPLVWWAGARLVDERERACDEEVIRRGSEPHVYAESILRTCQFYVEAPLACMAGVTGADLKRRIEQIMRNRPGDALSGGKQAFLGALVAAAVAGPILFGALYPPLEARTARRSDAENVDRRIVFYRPSGPFRVQNFTVRELLRFGYGLSDDRIVGAPPWIDTDSFDIELEWDRDPAAGEVQALVRNLLALEFGLDARVEQRPLPAYALVRTGESLGPQLRPSRVDCATVAGTGVLGVTPCQLRRRFDGLTGGLYARGVTMEKLAEAMSGDGYVRLDRPVVDRTGLAGAYDVDFEFSRVPHRGPLGVADGGPARVVNAALDWFGYPSLTTALETQLGLTLVEQDAPVDVLVIDRVERP